MTDIKQEVRQFYDQVGWKLVSDDIYQNARYEDLRPVSRQYIHRCHMRVKEHLQPHGHFLLDAGSGPIQYPEYLEYARNYDYRVCADISITALKEARKRIGEKGLYVVTDVANLPFKADAFEGLVSLHTIHHLPEDEHLQAYRELHRVLSPGGSGVVVNGWPASRLMNTFEPLMRFANRIRSYTERKNKENSQDNNAETKDRKAGKVKQATDPENPKGTFTSRHDVAWIKEQVGAYMPVEIRVWRSASVRFLRALIHPKLGGRAWLGLLYRLEERFPHYFGENGKYPLIVIRKNKEEQKA